MLRKWQLFILIALAALISSAISLVRGAAPELAIYRNLSAVVGVLGLVLLVYDRWLWRLPRLYPGLVGTPNIRGTWEARASIVSLDPRHHGNFHGYAVVHQTSSHIAYTIFWDDGLISKMADEAPLSAKGGMCAFAATYRSLPEGRPLDIGIYFYWAPESSDTLTLRYRTSTQQTGDIVLSHRMLCNCDNYQQARKAASAPPSLVSRLGFALRWA